MSEKTYEVPAEWAKRAFINGADYKKMYERSLADPNGFWAEHGKRIHWMRPFTKVKNTSFDRHNVSIKWFEDGATNAAYNCIDRHLATRANQIAIIWEGDDPKDSKKITYKELHDEVCRFANVLRNRNVEKGDRVTIYLPMIPEAVYAMLACARIGAIHSVVFGGFLARIARRPHRGLPVEGRDHRRRGAARRPQSAAQGQHGRGDREKRRRRPRHRGQAHPRGGRYGPGARRLLRRGRRHGHVRMPVRRDACGGSALHPLHLRLDRQAEGRAAYHRRLSRLRGDDASICLRLP